MREEGSMQKVDEYHDQQAIEALLIHYCFILDQRRFGELETSIFSCDARFGEGATNWQGAAEIAQHIGDSACASSLRDHHHRAPGQGGRGPR